MLSHSSLPSIPLSSLPEFKRRRTTFEITDAPRAGTCLHRTLRSTITRDRFIRVLRSVHLVCSAAAFPHHLTALTAAKRKSLSERQTKARHRLRHSPARRTLTASNSITSPRGSIPHQRSPTTGLLDSLLANRAVTKSHPIQEHERTISGGARSLMERREPHKASQTASPTNKHEKGQRLLPQYLTEPNCQPHPEARANRVHSHSNI